MSQGKSRFILSDYPGGGPSLFKRRARRVRSYPTLHNYVAVNLDVVYGALTYDVRTPSPRPTLEHLRSSRVVLTRRREEEQECGSYNYQYRLIRS